MVSVKSEVLALDDVVTLHIGLHKTGTTSIQHFLQDHRLRLRACGVACYQGQHMVENHVELHTAALRPHRPTPFKIMSGIVVDDGYVRRARAHIEQFLCASTGLRPIFSAEGLSYIRYPDELDTLRHLLSARSVRIVAYIREREDLRASYTAALRRQGAAPSGDPDSFAYIADDSWLFDYDARLRPFREAFGSEQVEIIDYDACMRRDGSVIPSFIEVLGCADHFTPNDWSSYWLNKRRPSSPQGSKATLRGFRTPKNCMGAD